MQAYSGKRLYVGGKGSSRGSYQLTTTLYSPQQRYYMRQFNFLFGGFPFTKIKSAHAPAHRFARFY